MKKYLLLAITLTLSAGAWADCDNPQNSFEIQKCLTNDLGALQKQLKSAYEDLYKQTNAKNELRNAQNAWQTYKDLQCGEFTAVDTDHSPASTAYDLACQADLTQQRIEFLQNQTN